MGAEEGRQRRSLRRRRRHGVAAAGRTTTTGALPCRCPLCHARRTPAPCCPPTATGVAGARRACCCCCDGGGPRRPPALFRLYSGSRCRWRADRPAAPHHQSRHCHRRRAARPAGRAAWAPYGGGRRGSVLFAPSLRIAETPASLGECVVIGASMWGAVGGHSFGFGREMEIDGRGSGPRFRTSERSSPLVARRARSRLFVLAFGVGVSSLRGN